MEFGSELVSFFFLSDLFVTVGFVYSSGRSCKSFVILGFGWRKTNRTLIVQVVHNKRG